MIEDLFLSLQTVHNATSLLNEQSYSQTSNVHAAARCVLFCLSLHRAKHRDPLLVHASSDSFGETPHILPAYNLGPLSAH